MRYSKSLTNLSNNRFFYCFDFIAGNIKKLHAKKQALFDEAEGKKKGSGAGFIHRRPGG
jgi:hypothetical protein